MPIYEYRCASGHNFEVIQAMTADPITECEVCGEPVERVFHPVAVHFKGSGFYTTDYARKSSSKPSSDGAGKESGKAKDSGNAKDSGKNDSGSKSTDTAKAGA